MLSGKTWVNNHAHVLKGYNGVNNKYVCYYLNQIDYHGYVNGATRLKLTQANMRKLPFILAPKNEQIRIANKLDSLLAKVEAAQTRLDKIPTLLKRFRQAVLAAATSGELTREWREENDEAINLQDFLSDEIILNSDIQDFEIPNSWAWVELGQLVTIHNNRRIPLKVSDRDKRSGIYPYYGAFGIIDDIDDYIFDGEYLLLAEDGKNLESRKRPIALIAHGKFWVNNHAHVLQANERLVLDYLNLYINSSSMNLAHICHLNWHKPLIFGYGSLYYGKNLLKSKVFFLNKMWCHNICQKH